MKKWVIVAFMGAALVGCGDDGTPLGGRYYLYDLDQDHVYLIKKGYAPIVVDEQVVDYRVVSGYLLVLRKVAEEFVCYDKNNISTGITHYTDKREYWIIHISEEHEIGPLSDQAYAEMLKKLQLPFVRLNSSDYQNDDQFEAERKTCIRLVQVL